MGENWDKLCTYEALKGGWYLASNDIKGDFLEVPFIKEQFASNLDENLNELVRQLKTEQFNHKNVIRIAVTKGNLSTRPGAFIPFDSRIVLFAAIKLIAKHLDDRLIENVFSCRVKKRIKNELFKEGSLNMPPFIKRKTFSLLIDPFEAWYGAWPEFEKKSIDVCIHGDHKYMAVTDISAYFENIQLEILRDQLFDYLPDEQQITNLFIGAFSSWTSETPQGRKYLRGIPQGSDIPRFFGNLFLVPIDLALEDLSEELGIIYYRYMDDVRIFAKTELSAKKAILKFETEIRKRHLNLQSAKTKILNERFKEVSHFLIDKRLTDFEYLKEQIKEDKDKARKTDKAFDSTAFIRRLESLQSDEPDALHLGELKIKGANKALTGLSDRLFRRIIGTYLGLGSSDIVPRLLSEIKRNSDRRYCQLVVSFSRAFPRLKRIQSFFLELVASGNIMAPSIEAELIRACRYQSRISDDLKQHCLTRARDNNQNFQVRLQALVLLARTKLNIDDINVTNTIFNTSDNILIKRTASLTLIRQRGNENENFLRSMVFHPNNELREFGRYLHSCKTNEKTSRAIIKQAFKPEYPWLLVDYIPLLFLQSQTSNSKIRDHLRDKILTNKYHKNHINMDMRDLLSQLINWTNSSS